MLKDRTPSSENLSSVIPFGGDILMPVKEDRALGTLACIQGLESGETDDQIIWDAPGADFPVIPEFPEQPETPTEK
jgi:hypothetical protein